MESTVVEGKYANRFPVLMVARDGEIVLFTGPTSGVVMNNTCKRLGTFDKDWAISEFKPFHGTVTLEN